MKYYARISQKHGSVKEEFACLGADEVIFDDEPRQKRPGSAYNKMKDGLSLTHEPLTVSSIFDFGRNPREITKELDWFVENGIEVHILDMPSTMKESVSVTEILRDVNATYAAREIENLKEGKKRAVKEAEKEGREIRRSTGRHRIPYPPDWEREYARWSKKEITSSQFMADTGLSQGTFYNLLRQYKEELIKEEREAESSEKLG